MKKKVLSLAFVGMFACASVVCGMEPRPDRPQSPAPAQARPASFDSLEEEVAWLREHNLALIDEIQGSLSELYKQCEALQSLETRGAFDDAAKREIKQECKSLLSFLMRSMIYDIDKTDS